MRLRVSWRLLEACVLCLATTVVLVGCGSKEIPGLVRVQGVVVYEGKPLPYASMTFAPDVEKMGSANGIRVSTAQTDAKGRFELFTVGRKGALPGDYLVSIEKYIPNSDGAVERWEKERMIPGYVEPKPANTFEEEETLDENGAPVETVPATFDVVSAIPLKYAEKETSNLKATVPEKGTKDLVFQLYKE